MRTSLRALQWNSIAAFCSVLGGAMVQFFFPDFDEQRNIALQALEGVVGLVFHYIFSYELFIALVPPQYNAVTPVIMTLFAPVMVPQALHKLVYVTQKFTGLVRVLPEQLMRDLNAPHTLPLSQTCQQETSSIIKLAEDRYAIATERFRAAKKVSGDDLAQFHAYLLAIRDGMQADILTLKARVAQLDSKCTPDDIAQLEGAWQTMYHRYEAVYKEAAAKYRASKTKDSEATQ